MVLKCHEPMTPILYQEVQVPLGIVIIDVSSIVDLWKVVQRDIDPLIISWYSLIGFG